MGKTKGTVVVDVEGECLVVLLTPCILNACDRAMAVLVLSATLPLVPCGLSPNLVLWDKEDGRKNKEAIIKVAR
jgi:hypothetical protein